MTVLRLMYRPSWPDSEPGLAWSLLGPHGERIDGGDDAPQAWPRSQETELVLPAGLTLFTAVALPPASRERQLAAAGFALEEQLTNDPQANLYALGRRDGEQTALALTEAFGVRRAVAMLRKLGRAPDRIVPEEMLLPEPAPDEWLLAASDSGASILRQSVQRACLLPPGVAGDALLAHVLQQQVPQRLACCGEVGTVPGVAHEVRDTASWRAGRCSSPFDFAHGELAASRLWRCWAPSLRRSALIVGGWIVLQLVFLLGEAAYLAWQKAALSREIRSVTAPLLGAQALPGSSALPMLRAVDRLRAERGQPVRDDALALLARLGEVAGKQLQLLQLESEGGRVLLRAATVPDTVFDGWRVQLAAQGIVLGKRQGEGGVSQWTLAREP